MHFKNSKTLLMVFICLWALAQYFFARPESIVNDWMGWRQSDTQTIARNFLTNGINVFYPQINWGGDGPGYVESEFQLYPALIAFVMKCTGEAEWPGQVLNIIFFSLTAFILFQELASRFGILPAFISAAAFLTSISSVFLSTSVQPDSLCFMLYSFALVFFIRFVESEDNRKLYISFLFSICAALVKPTSLHAGLIQFLLILFIKPRLFRKLNLWAVWCLILAVVIVYLFHAHNLYTLYGNTFGIGLGGDTKFPTTTALLTPFLYIKLVYMTLFWGISPLGAVAFFYLIYKREIRPIEWAILIGNIVLLLGAMRVTSNRADGPHYHIFTSFLGAWVLAHASEEFMRCSQAISRKKIIALMLFFIGIQYTLNLNIRIKKEIQGCTPQSIIITGKALKEIVRPGECIIVRSIFLSRAEAFWGGGINNYEDPRLFYMTRTRGWVIACDVKGIDLINDYVKRGARFYIETGERLQDPELYDWLKLNTHMVFETDSGRIYSFVNMPLCYKKT